MFVRVSFTDLIKGLDGSNHIKHCLTAIVVGEPML